MDNLHNGWTNHETWLVNVWFNPESKSDVDYIREFIESDIDKLPLYLKDFVNVAAIDWAELKESIDDEIEADDDEVNDGGVVYG